jgi:pimeloyl-ACP methyl ester carboxylesterase
MDALPEVIYLHGLGSSPQSDKATLVAAHLRGLGYKVHIPALSLPSLAKLSVEVALDSAALCIEEAHRSNAGCVVIGSSFGGFLALKAIDKVAEPIKECVRAVVLMAPVLTPWHPTCGMITAEMEAAWNQQGSFPVEESATGAIVQVHVEFIRQLKRYSQAPVRLVCPTLIIHGEQDEVVPVTQSIEFCANQPSATLCVVQDVHRLLADPGQLLTTIEQFIGRRSEDRTK